MKKPILPSVAGCAIAVAMVSSPAAALAAETEAPIQDNSFLVEEAYNQEFGVVQHISTFVRPPGGSNWGYSFTQEWPAGGQTHQLGFTGVAANYTAGAFTVTGWGDLLLNYRLQAIGNGETPVAFSPRLSLVLPTGDASLGLGSGTFGYQVNLPFSAALGRSFVSHTNVGTTYLPSARDRDGNRANPLSFNVGQSFIWLVTSRFNPMVEAVWNHNETVSGQNKTDTEDALVVNPGFRAAFDLPGDLQVVPGVSVPITLTGSRAGEVAVFGYLSFEHPFMRAGGAE